MADREKVISGLEICKPSKYARTCGVCPYNEEMNCDYVLWHDAIALLKANEPVKPEREGSGITWWYVCGSCRTVINPNDKYCHECGRKVKWE